MIKLCRLPFAFDPTRLLADLQHIEAGEWMPHFNTAYYEGEWSGVSLRAVDGAAQQLYPDPTAQERFADTPILARCPYFQEVLATFQLPLEAVRLLKLRAGSSIREHRDYKLGYEDGAIRLHIPLITDAEVAFYLDGQRLEMQPGECWYVNVNLPHRVENRSKIDRIHLVIDGVVNEWVHSVFAAYAVEQSAEPLPEQAERPGEMMTPSFITPPIPWELPWPRPEWPAYQETALGNWSLKWVNLMPQLGYFQNTLWLGPQYSLLQAGEAWMSTALMELESNAPHIAAARGHTVVMGAGMGLALYNILRKPEVNRVTLVERDPMVIALLHQAAQMSNWPGFTSKLTVKLIDAFTYTPDQAVDYLYIDIWQNLGSGRALAEAQQLQSRVKAASIGWWGQEISFLRWLEQREEALPPKEAHYLQWQDELKLPLTGGAEPAYMACMAQLAQTTFYQRACQRD